jgi:hypothetical protein
MAGITSEKDVYRSRNKDHKEQSAADMAASAEKRAAVGAEWGVQRSMVPVLHRCSRAASPAAGDIDLLTDLSIRSPKSAQLLDNAGSVTLAV